MERIRSLMSSFDRLSAREKGLIIGMVATVVGIIIFFVVLSVSSSLSELEAEVAEGRKALRQIYALADDYREVTHKREAMQRLIDDNPITSLRIPVNAIAKRIVVKSDDANYAGAGKRLSDLVSYGGKTTETRIESKKAKKRKRSRKKQDDSGNYEIEQSMEFSDIPLEALYEFLEELQKSKDLIFIRRLELSRRFNNLEHARATLHVSTIRYREGEAME